MPEMTRSRKITEMMKILSYIYAQSRSVEVTPLLAQMWVEQVSGFSLRQCWSAAKELFRTKSFGEPKFSDFWEILKKQNSQANYNPWGQETPRLIRAVDVVNKLRVGSQKLLGDGK